MTVWYQQRKTYTLLPESPWIKSLISQWIVSFSQPISSMQLFVDLFLKILPSSFPFLLCISHCNSKVTRVPQGPPGQFLTPAPISLPARCEHSAFPQGMEKTLHWFLNEANDASACYTWGFTTAWLFFKDGQEIQGKSVPPPMSPAPKVAAATLQLLSQKKSGLHCWLLQHPPLPTRK